MLNEKQIATAISAIGRNMKKLREEVQAAALGAVGFMVETGRADFCNKLYENLAGANRISLAKWFRDTGLVHWNGEKFEVRKDAMKEFINVVGDGDRRQAREMFEAEWALKPAWHEDSKNDDDRVTREYDAIIDAEAFLAKIARKAKVAGSKHTDFERYLRGAVEQYKADMIGA